MIKQRGSTPLLVVASEVDSMFRLVPSPAKDALLEIVHSATDTLFVVAPYIKQYGVHLLLEHGSGWRVKVLTNLSLGNVAGNGYDLDALLLLGERYPITVSSLGKLHAKVYVADEKIALLTSANLTYGGLQGNYEYGVLLRDKRIVRELVQDLNAYFELGNVFDRAGLMLLQDEVERLKTLQRELQKTPEAQELRKAMSERENRVKEELLRNRARGKSINAVLSETLIYLLRARGALSTAELHPLIQEIHPDICDDTIDRVINGQHFGKKWKHMVRNAQQHLKSRGTIALIEGKWQLVERK